MPMDLTEMRVRLSGRSQNTKSKFSFSDFLDDKHIFPRGSILGPILFNMNLFDFFFPEYSCEFTNVDDPIPYEFSKVMVSNQKLEETMEKLFD